MKKILAILLGLAMTAGFVLWTGPTLIVACIATVLVAGWLALPASKVEDTAQELLATTFQSTRMARL